MQTQMQTRPPTARKICGISVFHGASAQTIPLDISKVQDYDGTIEGALRAALSKHVHPGIFATLDDGDVDVELYSAGTDSRGPTEKPLSLRDQWAEVVQAAEHAEVELGVARHARGGRTGSRSCGVGPRLP